jgi:predicted DNA-binding transcriptional regulator AlpA
VKKAIALRNTMQEMTMAEGRGDIDAVAGTSTIEPLLHPEDAAKILNLSTSWLAKARGAGGGPEFVKIGRAVRYSESSLRKFIKAQTRSSAGDE